MQGRGRYALGGEENGGRIERGPLRKVKDDRKTEMGEIKGPPK